MRIFALPLSALLFLFSPLPAQAQGVPIEARTDLYIPSVLHGGIRADKAHAGDKVRLEMLEGILVSPGIVIPASAHLYGHVVEARVLTASSESRLSIEVDRAEWRHHELPLHAFIYGFGIRQLKYEPRRPDCDLPGNGGGSSERESSQGFGQSPHEPACNTPLTVNDGIINLDDANQLSHLELETNHRNGSTVLISKVKNVHLSGGALIILHNVPLSMASGLLEKEALIAGQK